MRRRILKKEDNNFVDLGLSVLWASGNICKSGGKYYVGEPTDKGCYYSWANIEGHNKGEGYRFGGSIYNSTPGASLRYSSIASNDSAHDAALACLGDGYRMPTKAEFNELINNCTVTWVTSYNGVSVAGSVFKSKIAGYTDKEIFIPASGYYDDGSLNYEDSGGYCWSSTCWDENDAYLLLFYSGGAKTLQDYRRHGKSVRAVMDRQYEYVDFGLPSGTLWATMNVGATSETEYGNYYMYGKGSRTYNKYDSTYTGTESPLAASADTAVQVWGGQWHMPTSAQCRELINECTWSWGTSGGTNGYTVSKNGKNIFLPAAGCLNNGSPYAVGRDGYYWSSTLYDRNTTFDLCFYNGGKYISQDDRSYGCPVRPVIG